MEDINGENFACLRDLNRSLKLANGIINDGFPYRRWDFELEDTL